MFSISIIQVIAVTAFISTLVFMCVKHSGLEHKLEGLYNVVVLLDKNVDKNFEMSKMLASNPANSNGTQDTTRAFFVGNDNMLKLIKLSLYKLQDGGELFGVDNIIQDLKGELNAFSQDQKLIDQWKIKWNEHIDEVNGKPEDRIN